MAIKFFIQKDIPDDIQAEVCETITVGTCILCSVKVISQTHVDRAWAAE